MIRHKSLRPSLSANIAENQQVTNLHPDLHPLLGAPLIDDMLKVLKFWCILIFQLVTSIFGIFEANSTPSNRSTTPYWWSILSNLGRSWYARSTYGRLPEQERQNFPKNELGFWSYLALNLHFSQLSAILINPKVL